MSPNAGSRSNSKADVATLDPFEQYRKQFVKPVLHQSHVSSKFLGNSYAHLFSPESYRHVYKWLKDGCERDMQKRFHRLFKRIASEVPRARAQTSIETVAYMPPGSTDNKNPGAAGAGTSKTKSGTTTVEMKRIHTPFTYTNVTRVDRIYDRDFREAAFYGHGILKEQSVQDVAAWMRAMASEPDKEEFRQIMSSMSASLRMNHPHSHTKETFVEMPNFRRDRALTQLPKDIAIRKVMEAKSASTTPEPSFRSRAMSTGSGSGSGSSSMSYKTSYASQFPVRTQDRVAEQSRDDRATNAQNDLLHRKKPYGEFDMGQQVATTTNKTFFPVQRPSSSISNAEMDNAFRQYMKDTANVTASTGIIVPHHKGPSDEEVRQKAAVTTHRVVVRPDQQTATNTTSTASFNASTTYGRTFRAPDSSFGGRPRSRSQSAFGTTHKAPWAFEDSSHPLKERYLTESAAEIGAYRWRVKENDERYGPLLDTRPAYAYRRPLSSSLLRKRELEQQPQQ